MFFYVIKRSSYGFESLNGKFVWEKRVARMGLRSRKSRRLNLTSVHSREAGKNAFQDNIHDKSGKVKVLNSVITAH